MEGAGQRKENIVNVGYMHMMKCYPEILYFVWLTHADKNIHRKIDSR